MSLLGGFGRSARRSGWAVLDGLHSKELIMLAILLTISLLPLSILHCYLAGVAKHYFFSFK